MPPTADLKSMRTGQEEKMLLESRSCGMFLYGDGQL